MKKRYVIALSALSVATAATIGVVGVNSLKIPPPVVPSYVSAQCDPTLWNHVYAGDPRKFEKPQDRLQVLQACITVTGVIETAKAEADGDYHIRLKLDAPYEGLLNAKNISGQRSDLVLEPVCANPITQKDTLQEGSCDNFSQNIFTKSMIGKHVTVTGVYVTDMEHGWNEVHPVTSIVPDNE